MLRKPMEPANLGNITLADYEPLIGGEAVQRISEKANPLHDFHVANVNATYYGGGVASLLQSLTLLMNSVGIRTGWRVIQGSPDFFSVTKKMHNALQGNSINLTQQKKDVYESVIAENAVRNHLDHDIVIVHDPQPLPMITHYRRRGPWIWRCHVDMTQPDKGVLRYLSQYIEKYDAIVLTLDEYRQTWNTPQVFIQPAINPFSIANRELSEQEITERLEHYNIPTDLPIITQISRFDRWKDPSGVISAFHIARKEVDATLVLLGNIATDDPEGAKVYESILERKEERVIILCHQDSALVNALQRRSTVVLQKSVREGFGLTVAEAMWKGTPVIGGNVGGIKHQIRDGEDGFLVSTVEEAAARIVQLLKNQSKRNEMGKQARETVRRRYLLTRYLEEYIDLFASFEARYRIRG
jgi:trehalose synthase